jgi:hypothetical protein
LGRLWIIERDFWVSTFSTIIEMGTSKCFLALAFWAPALQKARSQSTKEKL